MTDGRKKMMTKKSGREEGSEKCKEYPRGGDFGKLERDVGRESMKE